MSKKTMLLVMCPALLLGATTAQGVTVDLTSPQEGGEVTFGDVVSVTITVHNDGAKRDLFTLSGTVDANGLSIPINVQVKSKVNLKAGAVYTQTVTATIPPIGSVPPEYIPPGPVDVTLSVTATGKKSGATGSDSLTVTFNPGPAP